MDIFSDFVNLINQTVNQPHFYISLLQIILIDILLGGDNAILIGMACRQLPPAQRRQGIIWGTAGAVVLRIILISFAVTLLEIPFLKLVGGILLFWIGVKLLIGEDEHKEVSASDKLIIAIKTIIIADLVMSVDNVIAVSAAAKGDILLVVFGILLSIPIVVWGSQLVLKIIDRYPALVIFGGALLGWLGGGLIIGDVIITDYIKPYQPWLKYIFEIVGAAFVIFLGNFLKKKIEVKRKLNEAVAK